MKIFLCCIFFGIVAYVYSIPTQSLNQKNLVSLLPIASKNNVTKSCSVCKSVVSFLHAFGSAQLGEKLLGKFSDFICDKFKIESYRVCHSIIDEFKHLVWDIFFDAIVEPNELCGWLVGNSCAHTTAYFASWNVSLPARIHAAEVPESPDLYQNTSMPLRILQLTDTHLDKDYLAGAVADCDEPLCCRKEDGKAGKDQTAAPKFGYPGFCDTNLIMFHTMLQDIADNHKDVKYIYWTGDVPAHNVWNQSKANQEDSIQYATDTFQKYFPTKKIFPCLGNHEGFPVNSFPPPFITGEDSGEWLRSKVADEWGTWLPLDTKDTILKGGYYTTIVEKNLRLISLNMNYGSPGNWWLWVKSADPSGQLQWLTDTLYKAEQAGEKVHIIGHIPPDHCLKWFSYNYYRIIDRFYDTVTGQFFGHTHHDEFRVFFDMETFTKPISIAYIAPSVTTYHNLNPGFRIYDIDGEEGNSTWHVVGHDTFYVDLLKADKIGKLQFELEYNAMKSYGMQSLSPSDWHKLLHKFMDDDEFFQLFYKNYFKQYKKDRCTGTCKTSYICTMLTGLGGGFHDFCHFGKSSERRTYLNWRLETYNKC